nr:immunoglobulin light chain junction region [Macaca mulatta]
DYYCPIWHSSAHAFF